MMRKTHTMFFGLFLFTLGIQMTDGAEKSLFGLTEEQYWHEPTMQKPAMNFAKELLWKRKPGIFIDMPQAVFTDRKISVPLCGFRSQSTQLLHKFTLARSCKLVLINLQTGEIQAVQFARNPDIQDDVPPSPGWLIEDFSIDLAEQSDLGSKLGKYSARILSGPESSNSRQFALYPKQGEEKNIEFETRLKRFRIEGGPPYPLLSGMVFDAKYNSNQHQTGKHAIWELDTIDSEPTNTRVDLKFRIVGLPRFVYPIDKPQVDEQGHRVYAALPVQLLAFDENRVAAVSENFGVPVLSAPSGSPENPVLEGRISLKLSGLLNSNRKAKVLSIWAISMGHFAMAEIKEAK